MPKMPLPKLPEPVAYSNDNIVVSYSELDTYRQCPLKHFIAYKNRWTKPPGEDSPLTKGTLWHKVLDVHYSVLKAWQESHNNTAIAIKDEATVLGLALTSIREAGLFGEAGKQSENEVLVEWMYEGHVERWGADRQWIILAVEYQLREFLPDPDGGDSEFVLKGKLDLIVMDVKTGKIWVIDHKSGANLPSQMELDIDDQFGLYTWLMQHRGIKIMGTIHNANRTTRNQADFPEYIGKSKPQTLEQRTHRTYLNRGDVECANIANDAFAVAANAYPARGRELPLYSSPDPRQCGWKCDFKESHLMARAGRPLIAALEERGFVQDFTRH